MEEKRYPQIDEKQGIDMCCEPVAEAVQDYETLTTRRPDGTVEVHDWIDDLDWSKFPSYGPFSEEEAISRIKEAEKDLDDPTKWITSEELDRQLYAKFPWQR